MRKLIICFSLLLFSQTCDAQIATQASDAFNSIDNFSPLLKSHVSKFLVEPGGAVTATNVRSNEEYGSLSKRPEMFLLGTEATAAIKSLYRYYESDETEHTIATYGTNVVTVSSTGTNTILYDNASSAKRWSFITYRDLLIGMNGTDASKKWDGESGVTADTDGMRTASNLLADLGAPFAELDTGTDLDASSWYQYKIAYYDGSNYTFSNARSNAILTGSNVYNIALTDIPLGPSGTTARYIYRTLGNASRAAVLADTTFYLVGTLSDNTTRTFADDVTDDTADDDAAPVWSTVAGGTNTSPPKGKFSVITKERLFIANDPSAEFQALGGKSTIYWSDVLNPDYFNYSVDYELIRPDDGDEITFVKNVLGILTIGKTRSINKFYTTSSSSANWTVSNPFSNIGCVAPYSAVNTSAGLIYLGRHGLYSYNGQGSTLISDSVTDKIRDVLATNIEDVAGVYHDNRYLMAYTSIESGAAENDRILILDIIRNSYVIDTKEIDSFANFNSGGDFGTLYSGSSGSDGNIYAHSNDFNKLVYRTKSQFDLGTAADTYVGGTETSPILTLGDDETWAESTDNWEDSGDKTWMVGSLTGTWTSPVIEINASSLDRLFWNESLETTGDATFAIRLGATAGGLSAWSSEFSDPSGSDVSGVTANNFIQIRGSLSSSLYTETPSVFVSDAFAIKLLYKKEGTTGESSIVSLWESGVMDLGGGDLPKRIKEIHVFYEGTSGTMTFEFDNAQGDTYSFDIDLSVDPTNTEDDEYFGTATDKIFVYIPPFDTVPTGRRWTYKIEETGTTQWKVRRIVTRFDVNSYTTYK